MARRRGIIVDFYFGTGHSSEVWRFGLLLLYHIF